jgi:hypothetical protein
MQQHYAAFDKASIADRVFGQIQSGGNGAGANGNGKPEKKENWGRRGGAGTCQ